jgi:hypothetical protein
VNDVPSQSKVLRRLYLMLFLRGRSARGLNRKTASKSIGGKLAATLVFYALMGCICLTLYGQSLFSLSLYLHSAALFFIGMFVASSAGEVLFNKDEAEILLHRPLDPRSMLWAKISVLLQVSLWLALAFNLAGFVMGSISENGSWLFIPAHAISAVISAFFCTGIVVLIYQLCLKWFGRERLDGLMTTAQVLMTMLLVVGGQVAPHLMRKMPGEVHLGGETWWLALLPSAWFAALDDTLIGRGNPASWALAGVGVIVTTGVIALAFGKLAGTFQSGLQMLGESKAAKPISATKPRLFHRLVAAPPLSWLLRNPVERAGFLLVSAYLFRDRDVKLRFYPGMAPMLVMPVVLLLNGFRAGAGEFIFMLVGGYIALVPMMALNLLQHSQDWQAADVFRITPTRGPGALSVGARKAVSVWFVAPAVVLLMIVCVWMTGDFHQIRLLLPGLLALPLYSRIVGLSGKHLPLSSPAEDVKATRRGLSVMVAMFSALAIGGIAALAKAYGYYMHFLTLEAILMVAGTYLMDRRIRALEWEPVE